MSYIKEKSTSNVESEYAPLRKVVLTQPEFIFPLKGDQNDTSFLPQETIVLYKGVDI